MRTVHCNGFFLLPRPLPCMLPAMHAPLPHMPPAMHAPGHACPLPRTPPTTPLLPCMSPHAWTESQIPVKTQPCRNLVAGGKNLSVVTRMAVSISSMNEAHFKCFRLLRYVMMENWHQWLDKVTSVIEQTCFLPPENEVLGKVKFSQASFILPNMHHRSHDQGRSASRGVCSQGGSATRGYGQQVGGTHATWMYSC